MTEYNDDEWGSAAKEAETSNFDPLPEGTYDFTVFDAKVSDYATDSTSKYAGEKVLTPQLRVSEGQKGTNRRIFPRIGLFPRFKPTQKNPAGAVNQDLFDFAKAVGWSTDDLKNLVQAARSGGNVEQFTRGIAGKPLSAKVRIVDDTHPKAEPGAKKNEARWFAEAKGVGGNAQSEAPADVWASSPAAQNTSATEDVWGSTPTDPALAAAAASGPAI